MNFLLHVDIESYITLGRTRGLNVSYKLVVPMHRRGNQRCKYKSVLSANSNNNCCKLRDFLRRARGPHKMGQGAACGPRAARWTALAYTNRPQVTELASLCSFINNKKTNSNPPSSYRVTPWYRSTNLSKRINPDWSKKEPDWAASCPWCFISNYIGSIQRVYNIILFAQSLDNRQSWVSHYIWFRIAPCARLMLPFFA